MLSGISLNLESVRLFWLALENWNVATSQNQGKAYYEGREGGCSSKHLLFQIACSLLLLLFHLIEAGSLSNWTERLRLAKVVVGWVVLQVHPLSLKTVAIEFKCLIVYDFVCLENLSSAVRLTSTLSMLPVLLLSNDKSSSGGTPGSKKSCPKINTQLITCVH